jgi:ribosomal protein L15
LKSIQNKPFIIKTSLLESKFSSGENVNPKTLFDKGLLVNADIKSAKTSTKSMPKIKIVASGAISKKLLISMCGISAGAKSLVEKAGGKVESF